jgi:O-antigen ligase
LIVAYLVLLALGRRLPGPTRLDWPIAALVLVYLAASLDSIDPRISLEAMVLIGMAVLTFYAFHDLWFSRLDLLIRGLVGVGVAGAILGLASIADVHSGWLELADAVDGRVGLLTLPPSVPRIAGVGDHVNLLAMALNMTLPFALVLALPPHGRLDRVLGVGATLIILIALFFTVSRGAWLGTAVALPVFALLYFFRDRSLSARFRLPSVSRAAVWATAVALFLAFLTGSVLFFSQWQSRPEWLFRASLSPRQDAASVGVHIIRDRPWLGSGPQTYALLYNVYSGDYPIENIHAHNGYIQAGVNAGLFGVLAVGGVGLVLLWCLGRAYRNGDPRRRALIAACVASLVTLAVHSLLDSPNHSKTALLTLAVVLAIAMRLAPVALPTIPPSSPRNLPRLAPLLLAPLLLAGMFYSARAHSDFNDSLVLLQEGDFTGAAARALRATDRDPNFAAYHFHAGVSQAIAYLVLGERDGEAPASLLDGSIESLRRGLELEPRSPVGWTNMALALQLAGLEQEAMDAAHMARFRAPLDSAVAAVAGTIFEWGGDIPAAVLAYSVAVTHDPPLIQSPFWVSNAFRPGAREGAIASSFLTPCQTARVTAMFAGYPSDLAALAAACRAFITSTAPGDARAWSDLAVALYALGDQEQALAESLRAVRRASDNAYVRTARGIVLAGEDDLGAVRHELLLGAYLGDPDAALLLRYTYAGAPDSPVRDNLRLPSDDKPPPDEVMERLAAALPVSAPMVFDYGLQHYLLGILYYRMRYFRESPPSIFIPGEWTELASPRSLLIIEALAVGPPVEAGPLDD